MISAIRTALGRKSASGRAGIGLLAIGLVAGLALAIAGCGGSVDGGLEMESHALRIDPQVVAPAPQGTGTFAMEVEGDSKGDRWEAQIYFSAVLGDQGSDRERSQAALIRSTCIESSCGRIVRITCTLSATQNLALPRRIDCIDSLGNRGTQDVVTGDYRVSAYFFPGNNFGFDDDYVDSVVAMTLR